LIAAPALSETLIVVEKVAPCSMSSSVKAEILVPLEFD
jgi:hypothetical protein